MTKYPPNNLQVELLTEIKDPRRRGGEKCRRVVTRSARLLRWLVNCGHANYIINLWLHWSAEARPCYSSPAFPLLSYRAKHPSTTVLASLLHVPNEPIHALTAQLNLANPPRLLDLYIVNERRDPIQSVEAIARLGEGPCTSNLSSSSVALFGQVRVRYEGVASACRPKITASRTIFLNFDLYGTLDQHTTLPHAQLPQSFIRVKLGEHRRRQR
mmetsp:Transcript_23772/g.49544  ORF Transcript_23772/g.49544 Transcript_23772/m.49544 type:complete len:214 (+) Transcript_23772:696-1337(+)